MSERRTRSQTRESREEGIVVDPAGARDELPLGEGAVVLPPASEPLPNTLQAMLESMLKAQEEMREMMRAEREETRRMMSSMQEQLRQVQQQQEQPRPLPSPQQLLKLEYEQQQQKLQQQQRELQENYERRVAELSRAGGQAGASLASLLPRRCPPPRRLCPSLRGGEEWWVIAM